jgi:lysophospholipid acyltransferase (LPLAT)-like uncharacterized protein
LNKSALKLCQLLLYFVLRALHASYRYRIFYAENLQDAVKRTASGAYLICVWHEHLLPTSLAKIGAKVAPLVSPSDDGSIVDFSFRRFGFLPTRGSSSRGGPEARNILLGRINDGWSPALAVDGPTGPRRVVKPGAVDLARRSGHPILPLLAITPKPWILRSWDTMKIPKPFSKIYVGYGKPITVPAGTEGAEFIKMQEQLAAALNDLETRLFAEAKLSDKEKALQLAERRINPKKNRKRPAQDAASRT